MKLVVLTFVILSAFSLVFAEKQPFERYQSIIDRQMFGLPPPGFDPNKLPSEVQKSSASEKELTKEQEQLKSAVHFSVINVTSDGETQVGFTDNSDPKAPKNYFLKVGESRDGWTVKEADAEKATMVIEKGEIEVSLSLGGNSANNAAATARAGAGAPVAAPPRDAVGGFLGGNSLRARRLQRKQEAAAEQAKAAAAAAEREAERQEREEADKAQREQERAEQRQQLLAIQEELKRVREAKAAAETERKGDASDAENNAE